MDRSPGLPEVGINRNICLGQVEEIVDSMAQVWLGDVTPASGKADDLQLFVGAKALFCLCGGQDSRQAPREGPGWCTHCSSSKLTTSLRSEDGAERGWDCSVRMSVPMGMEPGEGDVVFLHGVIRNLHFSYSTSGEVMVQGDDVICQVCAGTQEASRQRTES